MIFFNAFLFSGIVCLIGQLIVDNTKLTAGHVTTLFTTVGVLLSFLGLYDDLIKKCGVGATILITNFGHALYSAGIKGYELYGVLGIFKNLLTNCSLVISITILFSVMISIFFKARD